MAQPDIQDEFIRRVHNEIPFRLIYVPTMKLMKRSEVEEQVQRRVDALGVNATVEHVRWLLRYAVLSHKWLSDKEEISFQDFSRYATFSGPGHEKLRRFCEVVKQHGVEFAWADTCCIDKSSSAELDESIRSMFRWYRNAHFCVIHLARSRTVNDLPNDEWFTRGWTLQELLAPRQKKFLGHDWTPLKVRGNRDADPETIISAITQLTDIPRDHLKGDFNPGPIDISQRMKWAAQRRTKRVEDRAYSLMGIFDVSFSTGYGEGGDRAFFRLVEAILHISNDRDILNWVGRPASIGHPTKMIPSSPECYLNTRPSASTTLDMPMQLTSMGLRLNLLVLRLKTPRIEDRIRSSRKEVVEFRCRLYGGVAVRVKLGDHEIRDGERFALGVWNVTRPTMLPMVFHACLLIKYDQHKRWEKLPTERAITIWQHDFRVSKERLQKGIWHGMYL